MSFLQKVSGLSLIDSVRSLVIQEKLRVEQMLFHERSLLTWFWYLTVIPRGWIQTKEDMPDPQTDQEHTGDITSLWLAWEHLHIPKKR